MANPPSDGMADDFFEQIFSMPQYGGALAGGEAGMVLQLGSGEGSVSASAAGGFSPGPVFPLQLSLEHGKGGFPEAAAGSGSGGKRLQQEAEEAIQRKQERDPVHLASLFPAFGQVQTHQIRPNPHHHPQVFHGQVMQGGVAAAPQPQAPRPRARARRGQATDPHSIAERLRREKIAERLRALQDLVPNTKKMEKAAMLDEILDYVKFLRLQVKVLSMSRLGGTGAVAQLVADISSLEGGGDQQVWEKWSTDGTEGQVAKLMEEDVGAAMQLLHSKALCMMPISLATTIYPTHHQSEPPPVKPEPNTPS